MQRFGAGKHLSKIQSDAPLFTPMINNGGNDGAQRFSLLDISLPDAYHVAQYLERRQRIRIAFVFQEQIEVGKRTVVQLNLVEQVGKLFLQIRVDEAAGLQAEAFQVERVYHRFRQIIGKEIPSHFDAGECFFEKFVVGVGEIAHGEKV